MGVWYVNIQREQRDDDHCISVGPTRRIAAERRFATSFTSGRSPHARELRSDVGHHFFCDEGFDGVADLHVVEILNTDAAFVAASDFRSIFLEPLQ